jgi:hypothetical protein
VNNSESLEKQGEFILRLRVINTRNATRENAELEQGNEKNRCSEIKRLENVDQKEFNGFQSAANGCENASIEPDDDRDQNIMSQRHRLKWTTENGIGHSYTLKSGNH